VIATTPKFRATLRALLLEAAEHAGTDGPHLRYPDVVGWLTATAAEAGRYSEFADAFHRAAGAETTDEFLRRTGGSR